jgi:hypothetical protein
VTAKHVQPVWDGGRRVAGNVVAACYECNHARSGVFNQTRRGSKFTIGDDTPISPFAGLQVLLRSDDAGALEMLALHVVNGLVFFRMGASAPRAVRNGCGSRSAAAAPRYAWAFGIAIAVATNRP